MTNINPLSPPPGVQNAEWATELIRFWVVNGEDEVTLCLDGVGSSEGDVPAAKIWGSILADIAKHAFHGQNQVDFNAHDKEVFFSQLTAGFQQRLNQEVGITGQLQGSHHAN